ncbi:MAG TPA: hypothetical protein VGI39_37225, partial [Polyangiaceae bacterium]
MIGPQVAGAHVVTQPLLTVQVTLQAPGFDWQKFPFAAHSVWSSFVQSTCSGTQLSEQVVVQP